MKSKLKLWAMAAGMALACAPAFSWVAMASSPSTNWTSIYYQADTEEEAIAGALKNCRQRHSDCKPGEAYNGTAFVIAKGYGGWGQAADPDPLKAAAQAVASCRKVARECEVMQAVWDPGVVWAAVATGDNGSSARVGSPSRERAEAAALEGCRKQSSKPETCAVYPAMTGTERLYYAYAASATREGYGRAESAERAKAIALESCMKNAPSGERCSVQHVLLNDSNAPEPKAMAKVRAQAERNSAADTPRDLPPRTRPTVASTTSTNVLRCSNQCVNGSCVRTFEDGRKERWQAPRRFNPLTGNWEWDITTNACGG